MSYKRQTKYNPGAGVILSSPNREAHLTYGKGGVLARLFRLILVDKNVDGRKYGELMRQYIQDPMNQVPDNKRDKTSVAGNLSKEFFRPQMTWKVLCKALRFLQFTDVEIILKTKDRFGRSMTHSTDFNLGDYDEIDAIEQLEKVTLKTKDRGGREKTHETEVNANVTDGIEDEEQLDESAEHKEIS